MKTKVQRSPTLRGSKKKREVKFKRGKMTGPNQRQFDRKLYLVQVHFGRTSLKRPPHSYRLGIDYPNLCWDVYNRIL